MEIIAVHAIKGGVGKTAAAVNLAALSALHGRRTLIWDLDPQGATSWYLHVKPRVSESVKKLLKGKKLMQQIHATPHRNLEVLPADAAYSGMELVLDEMKNSRQRIDRMLQPLREEYDTIFIDCPPGLSLVNENVFWAADLLLVPLIPTWLSERAFRQQLEHFRLSKSAPEQVFAFLSMVDRRRKLHREFLQRHRHDLPQLLPLEIPYSSLVEQMGEHREPLVYTHPRSEPAQAYFRLWQALDKEILT